MRWVLVCALGLSLTARAATLDNSVVYGLMSSDGAEQAVARLDELVELGVDVLWLSPITRTLPGDYGYAVTDYFSVREDFGAEGLHRLVAEAHRRGLKVVLDMAVNHTSNRHPYFLDAQRRGRASPYWDYYDRDPKSAPTHYFDWTHLPNLNYANHLVRELVTRAFAFWLERFDVDGFRLDAAWGVRDRDASFWPSLIQFLRAKKPQLVFLAEASARDPYWQSHGFDCAYDWAGPLGHWAWQEAFDDPAQIAARLRQVLSEDSGACALRFLDNNDTGARFITRHGPALTKLAAALMFTLPGVPLLFSGQEVGAEFLPYGGSARGDRRDPHRLRPFYQQLIALRRRLPALRSHEISFVASEPQVLAYLRGSQVLVVLNFGSAQQAAIDLPGAWIDLASCERVGSLRSLPLADHSFRILVPSGASLEWRPDTCTRSTRPLKPSHSRGGRA